MMMFLARWTLIVLLSIVVMFPPMWAITSWAVEPITGKGLDLRGLGRLVAWAAMSFVVIWPISLWASYRLLRGVGRRSEKKASPAPRPDVIRIEPQILGAEKSAPGADLSERGDSVPLPVNSDEASRAAAR